MDKQELVNAMKNLEVNDGFDIDSNTFSFGVRRIDLIDTNSIVFAIYGGELFSYWLSEFSFEEIADKIEDYISGFDNEESFVNGYGVKFLSLEHCWINDEMETF